MSEPWNTFVLAFVFIALMVSIFSDLWGLIIDFERAKRSPYEPRRVQRRRRR